MNSCLFTAYVQHTRLMPVWHRLQYPLYVYCLDLDELESLDRSLPLFGYNRFRPTSIHDRDYLDDRPGTIREKLLRFLEPKGYAGRVATVRMITSARYFNYVFNPVNFYYCFSAAGELVCMVAEVNNTFGERHVYIPHSLDPGSTAFPARFTAPKQFHVSPFNDLRGTYEFIFGDIRRELNIRLNLYRNKDLAFHAELWGNPLPLTAVNQLKLLLRHPLIPYLTIPRIYREAATLYFRRKLSYHPKPIPVSMMTIRKLPPTLVQKHCMRHILHLMQQIETGSLKLTLPDGMTRSFGNPASPIKAYLDINDWRFFSRVLLSGDIGLGESYMAGEWDSPEVVDVMRVLFENRHTFSDGSIVAVSLPLIRDRLLHLVRRNTLTGSRHNIRRHYDLSNDFFRTFLDTTMTYSCALFQSPDDTLEQAQLHKLKAMIRKAEITQDDHVLEIGCGWGSFAVEAVRETGCRVTGTTVSKEQCTYAREVVRREGLEDRITILLKDYRGLTGLFDKIVSIEMLEAVGHKYFGTFFRCCDRLLKADGCVALQTITIPDQRYDTYRKGMDWIRKHIFPGGHLPSLTALTVAMTAHSSLAVDQVENIGIHYARTLREWRKRFTAHLNEVTALGFDRTFQRKWLYYMACCEAGFAARALGDLQIVLTRPQ